MVNVLGEKNICSKCGKCCRLIFSLKSYEDFAKEAQDGNTTAINFLKLFLPYDSIEEILRIDEIYVNSVISRNKKLFGEDKQTYFYYCRYLGQDNICQVYDMRPKFCRQFPKNEFVILPQDCTYDGFAFIERENIKAKVRKAKEQLLDIKILRLSNSVHVDHERLGKVEKKCNDFIKQYKAFGSEEW